VSKGQKKIKTFQKVVKKQSKSCQKVAKNCQKVVKIQQTVVGVVGVWRGNNSSKAFGISFDDRPKAKRQQKPF
jgi:hypothetical protein